MEKLGTLQETFEYMKKCKESGVPGILRITGTKAGKPQTYLVSALTHGCEVNGLAALRHIINNREKIEKKLCGQLLLIINNIKAADRHFSTKTHPTGSLWYWCDTNMNRLPEGLMKMKSSAYEIRRAQELYPWYEEATCALDIHALPKYGAAMILDIKGKHSELNHLGAGLTVPVRIENVTNIQKGVPVGYFYGGKKNIPVIEIETCRNLTRAGEKLAQKLTMQFLFPKVSHPKRRFFVAWSLVFPDTSYRMHKQFRNFESVHRGQILAQNSFDVIRAPFDGHALFTRVRKKFDHARDIRTEILFLARERN